MAFAKQVMAGSSLRLSPGEARGRDAVGPGGGRAEPVRSPPEGQCCHMLGDGEPSPSRSGSMVGGAASYSISRSVSSSSRKLAVEGRPAEAGRGHGPRAHHRLGVAKEPTWLGRPPP